MIKENTNLRLAAACATLLALACSDSPTSVGATALLSVTPSDGAAGVGDPNGYYGLAFDFTTGGG